MIADHFSKSENFPFVSTFVNHLLFFTLSAVVSCSWSEAGCVSTTFVARPEGWSISDPTIEPVEVSLDQHPHPGASSCWSRCPHCVRPVQHRQLLPLMSLALHGHTYSSLVTTAWLSPWPCVSFFGWQTPWEYCDSKNGHLFINWWIIIRLPHSLWLFALFKQLHLGFVVCAEGGGAVEEEGRGIRICKRTNSCRDVLEGKQGWQSKNCFLILSVL